MQRSGYSCVVIHSFLPAISKRLAPAAIALLLSALAPATLHAQPQPDAPAPKQQQEQQQARYEAAATYSAQRGGLAMVVLKDGELVYENYANGADFTQPFRIFSGTKSFWGVLIMCMAQDKLVNLNEPVWETLIEWHADARKKRIRLEQLLNQSSGLDTAFYALNSDRVEHKYRYAVGLVCETEPGATFHYGPGHYYVLGEFITRKLETTTHENPVEYLKRRLLTPIGIETADWVTDKAGNPYMPSGAVMTARQWAKFGQFILDGGRADGQQILVPDLLRECFRPSPTNPQYGLSFWLNNPVQDHRDWGQQGVLEVPHSLNFEKDDQDRLWISKNAPRDMVAAIGAEGQRLYVIPSLKLVIVRLGQGKTAFRDSEFLDRLLPPPPEDRNPGIAPGPAPGSSPVNAPR